jgi:hypothetical protein
LTLARRVNGKSPVKATATRKETGKKVNLLAPEKTTVKKVAKTASKTAK